MNILRKVIFLVFFSIILIFTAIAQILDAERDFSWPGEAGTGTPGDVNGDAYVNVSDGLICAQFYVGLYRDLPHYRFPSQWMELHVPFVEMTQESMSQMVYVDKNAALESVAAFEIDFHSKNDNEQGTVWIDDVALYEDNSTGYRLYFILEDYDGIPLSGSIPSGSRCYVYNNSQITTPPAAIDGAIVAGGPSGTGNCLKVTYDLGGHHDDGEGNDITSLGVGLHIVFNGAPEKIPLGIYNLADVRGFSGIRFWIKLQKGVGVVRGFGDEPNKVVEGKCLGAYIMRCRLTSAVVGESEYFNYFGLNIDY